MDLYNDKQDTDARKHVKLAIFIYFWTSKKKTKKSTVKSLMLINPPRRPAPI